MNANSAPSPIRAELHAVHPLLAAADASFPPLGIEADALDAVVLGHVDVPLASELMLPHLTWANDTISELACAEQARTAWRSMSYRQRGVIKAFTGTTQALVAPPNWRQPRELVLEASHAIRSLGQVIEPGTRLSRKTKAGSSLDPRTSNVARGMVLQKPDLMSTSICPYTWNGEIHLKLIIGPRVQGLYVGPDSRSEGAAISHFDNEQEVILPADVRLVILDTRACTSAQSDEDGFGGQGIEWVVEAFVLPDS